MMQELTFVAPGEIAFREREAPRITAGEQALVRPIAVARCDLDYVFARGKAPIGGPFALGHECIADVLEVGDAVTAFRPGDRVVVPFQISCGTCHRCRRGMTGSCVTVPKLTAYGLGPLFGGDVGGAVSDVLLVPYADAMLVALDPALDPTAAAALGDNAIDGYRTVAGPLAREPGASVLIVGGGAPSVGLYAVAAARALGAGEVVYVDASPERTAIAERLGARAIQAKVEASQRVGRFAITVDASGREDGLRLCLASTDAWGECTSVGVYFTDVALPLLDMYSRGVRFVTGRIDARRDLPEALRIAASGAFALAPITTSVVAWDDAPAAWTEPATKLVIRR